MPDAVQTCPTCNSHDRDPSFDDPDIPDCPDSWHHMNPAPNDLHSDQERLRFVVDTPRGSQGVTALGLAELLDDELGFSRGTVHVKPAPDVPEGQGTSHHMPNCNDAASEENE